MEDDDAGPSSATRACLNSVASTTPRARVLAGIEKYKVSEDIELWRYPRPVELWEYEAEGDREEKETQEARAWLAALEAKAFNCEKEQRKSDRLLAQLKRRDVQLKRALSRISELEDLQEEVVDQVQGRQAQTHSGSDNSDDGNNDNSSHSSHEVSNQRFLEPWQQEKARLYRQRGIRSKKFGCAPILPVFQSHVLRLDGEPYRNKRGQIYHGSVCDRCEEDGNSHHHHPLRCNRYHPGWEAPGSAPELNGVITWHVRGGKVGSFDTTVAKRCDLRCGKGKCPCNWGVVESEAPTPLAAAAAAAAAMVEESTVGQGIQIE